MKYGSPFAFGIIAITLFFALGGGLTSESARHCTVFHLLIERTSIQLLPATINAATQDHEAQNTDLPIFHFKFLL